MLETVLGQHNIDKVQSLKGTGTAVAIASDFCSINETCFTCIKRVFFSFIIKNKLNYYSTIDDGHQIRLYNTLGEIS